jgi:hypothetical protein
VAAVSSLLRPVGPHPASVYWWRRALFGLAVLAVLALLWWALSALTGGDGDATTSPAPTESAQTAPTPSATPSASAEPTSTATPASGECTDDELTLDVLTDRTEYASDQDPRLTLRVVNSSERTCERDLGQAELELQVRSGDQVVWSSDHCNPGGDPEVVSLAPGDGERVTVLWDRARSAEGCPDDLGDVDAGDYVAVARVGSLNSSESAFNLQ